MRTNKKNPCEGCHYWRYLYPCNACHYMYVTGHSRGCEAGANCTRRKPMIKEKMKKEIPALLKMGDYDGIY